MDPQQSSLFDVPPTQPRMSSRAAVDRRRDGMNRARKHAERIKESWRLLGMIALEKFLKAQGLKPFLAEEFVEWCRKNEVAMPPDGRAWGSVITSARRLEIIEKVGAGLAVTSNLSLKPLWRARKG